jgi:hypothetical protein
MKFELRMDARHFSDEELLKDLASVAKQLSKESVTQKEYNEHGNFNHSTICNRFETWNNALEKAELKVSRRTNLSNEELFENLEIVWRTLGRQPSYTEITKPLSKYSVDVYTKRFSGWINACKKFIEYKNDDIKFVKFLKEPPKRSRYINEKTRLKILKKDNYRCVKCGRSPATHLGIALHIDHIKPFSKGGDSSEENLQTLCDKCNLGKGNDESV